MANKLLLLLIVIAALSLTGCPDGGDGSGGGSLGSPAPPFVYVANQNSNNVSAFQFSSGTGALTALAASTGNPFPAGTGPFSVTVDPTLKFLYVANFTSGNVSAYQLNDTGVLTPLAAATGNPFAAGTGPASIVVAPNGQFVYVANSLANTISVYTVDVNTGALSALAGTTGNPFPTGTTPQSLSITPNGLFLYVANSGSNNVSAFSINGTSGVLTPLAVATGNPFSAGAGPSDVSVSPNGRFAYVVNSAANNISAYSIDQATGALTPLAGATGNPFSTDAGPQAITIASNGIFAYVPNFASHNISAYAVDTATGVLAALAGATGNPFPAGTGPRELAVSQNGSFLYAANFTSGDVTAFTIDAATGVLTPLAAATGNPFSAGNQPRSIVIPGGR